jgi:hypothetical protein
MASTYGVKATTGEMIIGTEKGDLEDEDVAKEAN